MINFDFYSPTKIFFGRNRKAKSAGLLNNMALRKFCCITVKVRLKKRFVRLNRFFLMNKVLRLWNWRVEPNPKVSLVRKAIQLAKAEQVDLVLAVGGGSVIDSSKATAVGACTDEDIWRFSLHELTPKSAAGRGNFNHQRRGKRTKQFLRADEF